MKWKADFWQHKWSTALFVLFKYHQDSSSRPDNAGWFLDILSQMCRWVDNNWYSLYTQSSPRSHHLCKYKHRTYCRFSRSLLTRRSTSFMKGTCFSLISSGLQGKLTTRGEAVSPLPYRVSYVWAGSGVFNQSTAKRFLIIRSRIKHEMLGSLTQRLHVNKRCTFVCEVMWLTHKGQRHSWQQKDWGQCFHDMTEMERREAHCISPWRPAGIYRKKTQNEHTG